MLADLLLGGRDAPSWSVDGRDWPNREASRFVEAAGLRWHVQRAGTGPPLLLLHGLGASTHSWRDVLPRLARRFEVVAPDLPGHGFTSAPGDEDGLSLPGMAGALAQLLAALRLAPQGVVGHSAGAAVGARLCLDGDPRAGAGPAALVAFNGALTPWPGMQGQLFPWIARAMAATPGPAWLFAHTAGPARVEQLIAGTGSRLDARGVELYRRLFSRRGHVASALGMMARWDLAPLERDLPALRARLTLAAGEADGAVPPSASAALAARLPGATLVRMPGLGHLAHEERPDEATRIVEAAMAAALEFEEAQT